MTETTVPGAQTPSPTPSTATAETGTGGGGSHIPGWGFIQEAIRQVPATKFVLPIGAIGIVGAFLLRLFHVHLQGYDALYVVPIGLLLMVLVVLFANAAESASAADRAWMKPIQIFLFWSAAILLVAFGVLVLARASQRAWHVTVDPIGHFPAAPEHVSGKGPTFAPPRFGMRTIDACINDAAYPSASGHQCLLGAQQKIANAYCKSAGFASVSDFQTAFENHDHMSYKYEVNDHAGESVGQWNQDDGGGAVFTSITCEK